MTYLLGIDLGTSSVRAGIYREDGSRPGLAAASYPISTPAPDRSEQNPESWWQATTSAIKAALNDAGIKGSQLTGIAFDGQMHGGALLDWDGEPVCPAIIWPDSRSAGVLDEIADLLGDAIITKTIMNRPFPGTFAATLFWMRKHDPSTWKRIRHILPPKDYIRYRMCGLFNTDPSDASATLLFDQNARDWSTDTAKRLDIPIEWLPYVVTSDEEISETYGIEEEIGIPDGIPVIIGGADQACAAFGNGVMEPGTVLVTIGTGGQVCTPLTTPANTRNLSLNVFCHLPESRWYLMGATLSAGLCLRWFRDTFAPGVPFEDLSNEAAAVGDTGELMFLPYLPGKRSPDLNPAAHGLFSGIRLHHSRGHFVRAIMEGVAFDLRECLEEISTVSVKPERIILSGGGSTSKVWTQIMADVLGLDVHVSGRDEQACFGAALLAGIGTGAFRDYQDALGRVPEPSEPVSPDTENTDRYNSRYSSYLYTYRTLMTKEKSRP